LIKIFIRQNLFAFHFILSLDRYTSLKDDEL